MADQKVSVTLDPNLAAIAASNSHLQLDAAHLRAINAGNLIIVPPPIGGQLIPRGCLTKLYFEAGDQELDFIEVDGKVYKASNLRRFRDTLLRAACCHICINFCWNKEDRTISMLNLYPCSECVPNRKCGCGNQ